MGEGVDRGVPNPHFPPLSPHFPPLPHFPPPPTPLPPPPFQIFTLPDKVLFLFMNLSVAKNQN